jgi:hypothetical protein
MPKWLTITIGALTSTLLLSLTLVLWLGVIEFQKVEPELLSFLRDTHKDINTTSDNLNRNCTTSCGTLADINRTLGTVRGTFGQVEIAAYSFNKNQSIFFNQEQALARKTEDTLSNLDQDLIQSSGVLNDFSGDLGQFSTTIDGFNSVESSATEEFSALRTTTLSLNDYLNSEYVTGTTKNLYDFTGNLDILSGDITKKTHEFLYPAPCVGRSCWLKRSYTVLKDVGPMAEPFYWGTEAYKALR